MKLTKKQAEEMKAIIDGMVEEEPKNGFAKVSFCDKKNVLLVNDNKNCSKNRLIVTWGSQDSMDYFSLLDRVSYAHFWINAQFQPVELLLNGKWVKFNCEIKGRFLK